MKFTVLLALLALLGLLLGGCGSTREEQQNTTEQEMYEIGPMYVDTPVGVVTLHKTGVIRRMSRVRTTTETKEYTFPEVKEIGGAMLGGLLGPLGGGGTVGLIAAYFIKRIKDKNEQEREAMERDRKAKIAAMDAYAKDIEKAETDEDVEKIKTKHAERQKVLGIHDQLAQDRHGG